MVVKKPNRTKVRTRKSTRSKRPKKVTVAKLKAKLWRLFSEYTRLSEADNEGKVACVTCGEVLCWKDPKGRMQAGHYIPKKYCPALYFEEANVNPQCSYCNGVGEGMQYFHAEYIKKKYGEAVLKKIHTSMFAYRRWRKDNPKKAFVWKRDWLEAKIKEYETKLQKLKNK